MILVRRMGWNPRTVGVERWDGVLLDDSIVGEPSLVMLRERRTVCF